MESISKSAGRFVKAIATMIAIISLAFASSSAIAETELQSDGMKIYGQSELPKVLYIVPWKRRQANEIDIPTSKSLASDILEPIDPEIFRRQIRYHELLTQQQNDKQG